MVEVEEVLAIITKKKNENEKIMAREMAKDPENKSWTYAYRAAKAKVQVLDEVTNIFMALVQGEYTLLKHEEK